VDSKSHQSAFKKARVVYEEIMDVLEDMELAAIVESRKGQPTIKVDINDL